MPHSKETLLRSPQSNVVKFDFLIVERSKQHYRNQSVTVTDWVPWGVEMEISEINVQ